MTKLLSVFVMISFIFSQDFTYDVTLPEKSQMAKTMQRVGITDITVTYSRPSVKGRELWGKMLQYGMNKTFNGNIIPWRAGANENTTLEFTHDVKIAGKEVKAGIYGLHIILNKDIWTFILSSNSTSWGSYFYDESEDVLRFDVKPEASDHTELLTFSFDEVKDNSATLTFRWEKIKASFDIDVDVKKHMLVNLRKELRSHDSFGYRSWFQAAEYCYNNRFNYEEALTWVNKSIAQMSLDLNNSLKGSILIELGQKEEGLKFLKIAKDLAQSDRSKANIQKKIDNVN